MPVRYLGNLLRLWGLIVALLFFLGLAGTPVHSAGVVGDGSRGSCTEATLRAALSGGGAVSFDCGGAHTIIVGSQLTISSDTTIDGGGEITLSGGNSTRILAVEPNVTLTLQNITLRNGNGGSGEGGALQVARGGTAVITNTTFRGNRAHNGGAIAALGWNQADIGSTLTVSGSTFADNTATAPGIPQGGDGGGAIYIAGGSTGTFSSNTFTGNQAAHGGAIHGLHAVFSVSDSIFNNNRAQNSVGGGGGGAIYFDGTKGFNSTITISGSTFSGNSTNQLGGALFSFPEGSGATSINTSTFSGNYSDNRGQGGAIYHQSATGNGALTIETSTFNGNYARATENGNASSGGALWIYNTTVNIRNSTFVGNDATHGNAAALAPDNWRRGHGGALVTYTPITLLNTTFANNTAGFVGGALSGSGVTAQNSIFAGNSAGNPWDIQQQCTNSVQNSGGNFQYPQKTTGLGNDYECLAGVTAVDPQLGPIGDYGGSTQTAPLMAGSPAINAGSGCSPTDQRDFDRLDSCDSGAYEFGGGMVITQLSPPWYGRNEAAPINVTVQGAGFTANSVARWGGVDLTTVYLNNLQLQVTIPPSLLGSDGVFAITAHDPARTFSGGSASFEVVPELYKTYLPFIRNP